MFPNFQYFQKYKLSKLEEKKIKLVFLEPLGVREPNVPYFKGLIIPDLNPKAQERDGTFTFCHTLLKKAILHCRVGKSYLRSSFVKRDGSFTVAEI